VIADDPPRCRRLQSRDRHECFGARIRAQCSARDCESTARSLAARTLSSRGGGHLLMRDGHVLMQTWHYRAD
jgi:hypothetical protein